MPDAAPVWCCTLVDHFEDLLENQVRAAPVESLEYTFFSRRPFLAIRWISYTSFRKPEVHNVSQRRRRRPQL